MSKTKYRIRNWKDYNRSLTQRGSITVWFSSDAIDKWGAVLTRKRGRPFTYSDDAILTALLIGRDLICRTFQGQQSEAYVKAKALNIMTNLGMPKSISKAA